MVAGRLGRASLLAASVVVAASCSSAAHGSARPGTTTTSTPAPDSSAPTTDVPSPAVQWSACPTTGPLKGYQCGTIQVPRDPAHPGTAGVISLALARHPASGSKIGSLLFNPGGPGASGIGFLPGIVHSLSKDVRQHFDVVGFDPPGVGQSAPITCLDGPGLDQFFHADPDPPAAAGLNAVIAEDQMFAAGCQAKSGAELPYVSTVDAAMDMDYIRQAVGDPKLTYLGFSYGTLLGSTYASLFPTRIRAMVLDGAIDPSLPVVQGLDTQAAGFDADLRSALTACVAKAGCAWHPAGDPVQAFQQLLAQVRSHPLPAKGTARTVGPAEVLYGAGETLYSTTLWPKLYDALAQAGRGDGTDMLALFDAYLERSPDGTYSNEFEANAAVNCLDSATPILATIEADVPTARAAAPVFGLANLYSEIECAVWPVSSHQQPAPVHAAGSPPIVVVGTTGDPATPYTEAQALAAQLDQGVLLTRVGDGHTAYFYSSCIRKYVDSYLIQLAVPAAGIRCASD